MVGPRSKNSDRTQNKVAAIPILPIRRRIGSHKIKRY